MKWMLCILLFPLVVFSQYDDNYRIKFEELRSYLGEGQTGKAFYLLQDLYMVDSLNYYTNYLIGVCYTEQHSITEQSIKHLEYATKNILDVYAYIPYTEKRAPVFAWFYLTKAYAQNGYCEKAKQAMRRFKEVYGAEKKDYFTDKVGSFTANCVDLTWTKHRKRGENIVTKEVNYTSDAPLYGIQVGAFKELIPVREQFDDLKNVEAFMDKTGMLRYVIGHFRFKHQAESLLNIIKETGYKDAFIVDVNQTSKFSNEVVIVDNISFKAHIRGKIDYKVQVGAFKNRDSIPNELIKLYLQLDGLENFPDGELTSITSGNFTTYEDATIQRTKILEMGIPGAFVVAYNDGHKIPVKSAQKYLERKENRKKDTDQGKLSD